jgi:hypothetical protein
MAAAARTAQQNMGCETMRVWQRENDKPNAWQIGYLRAG